MLNNRKITISTAGSRTSINWKPQSISVAELFERLRKPLRSKETLAEYLKLKKSKQDELKDIGGFVGGELTGRRIKANVKGRDIIALDLDNCPPESTKAIIQRVSSLGACYCVYSTRKHSPAAPRLRVLYPIDRTVTAEEYEPIARKLAEMIQPEMTWFDPTTFQVERLMYWPSCCIDGEYKYYWEDKPLLSADGMLAKYEDWKNIAKWPRAPGEQKLREQTAAKQGDPTQKKGVVGAFCRTYGITAAMAKFIPEAYVSTDIDGRYTYAKGSTTGGAIVYDNDLFLYSHHATDPCGGKLVNAFDMVRLHLFSELDDEAREGTPVNKLPSYTAMTEKAGEDEDVRLTLYKDRQMAAAEDFEGISSDDDLEWLKKLEYGSKGRLEPTIRNLQIIMKHDPLLSKKWGRNDFTGRTMVLGGLPWSSRAEERPWNDDDDSGLRGYIETAYNIKSRQSVDDAWRLTSVEQRYNPVRDYLESCKWDGEERLDTLLIDYLGAEDTAYTRAVTRKTLCAAVARIYRPGIKFDNVLTLVGPQGAGKTTIVHKLAGDWFSDSLTTMQGREAFEQIQGHWIIEIAELSAMRKAELEAVKLFITKREDSFRKAYGRHSDTYKRQCIFIGTTNTHDFLHDITGNRRFWPVDVHNGRVKDIMAMTDSDIRLIWAEAREKWKAGEKLYLESGTEAEAKEIQEAHRAAYDAEGVILAYLDMPVPSNWEDLEPFQRVNYINNQPKDSGNTGKPLSVVCAAMIREEALKAAGMDSDRVYSSQYINSVIESTRKFKKAGYIRFKFYGKQRIYKRIKD